MYTLDQLRRNLGQWRDNLAEGWEHLRQRTLHALTHFKVTRDADAGDGQQTQYMLQGPRWGLIAAEVRESDDTVLVRLEVPGMNNDDFDISVVDDYLVVRGEKRVDSERSEGRVHIMECAYGRFERVIKLPVDVDDSAASARYRRGVLSVTLPKSSSALRRQIVVDSNPGQ
jgi:HSP20 family protein